MKSQKSILRLSIITIVTTCSVAAQRPPAQNLGTLHVTVVDHLGKPYPKSEIGRVRLESLDGKVDLSDRFSELTATEIPYGEYFVVIRNGLLTTGKRFVRIKSADTYLRVGMRYSAEGDVGLRLSSDEPLRGRLVPPPKDGSGWWVRIDALYFDYKLDAPIAADGKFEVTGLDEGSFLVSIFENSTLKISKSVNVNSGWIEELSEARTGDTRLILDMCDGCK